MRVGPWRASRLLRRILCLCTIEVLSCHVALAADIVVHDDTGREHRLAAAPQRIVSLLPSLTEVVCAVGGCARLVGVDRHSNFPKQADALPKLGGLEDTQVERIVALRPDIVLAARSARVIDRLESLGLRVVQIEPQNLAGLNRSIDLIAQLLDTPQQGVRLKATIDREIAEAARRVPPALRGQRVYFEVASAPYAAGASSFIGETLGRLGLSNVVPPELGPFPKLNPEYVVRSQPDIVMAVRRELSNMAVRPGWHRLQALHNGHSCGFEPARFEVMTRPGPRMGESALDIADCLAAMPGETR